MFSDLQIQIDFKAVTGLADINLRADWQHFKDVLARITRSGTTENLKKILKAVNILPQLGNIGAEDIKGT